MGKDTRIALTGFMGVGKSTVARHLSHLLRCEWVDLDIAIERIKKKTVAQIIDSEGEDYYRQLETDVLKRTLEVTGFRILSLGGGTWAKAENREVIRGQGMTSIWLESTFNHCWNNIRFSRKERPLARNKTNAKILFEERQKIYCLADWHFIVKPDRTSYDIAEQIFDEVFS